MKQIYLIIILYCFTPFLSAQNISEERDRKAMINGEAGTYQKMISFNINPNTLNYDLKSQRLELQLDPSVQKVTGIVTSAFVPNQNINSIYFDLANTLTVSEVKFHGNNLTFTQLPTKELKIDFANALPSNTLDSLSIKYSGIPDLSTGAFTTSTQSGTPVLYTLSEPYGAQEWFPTKQSMNDKIEKIQMIVTAPSQYNVASNGKLISETVSGANKTTFWQTKYPIPAYLIALGITNYTKFNDVISTPPFPFVNYVYPSTAADANKMSIIDWTKQILPVYEQFFGDYPYRNEKYGHMEFGWGGGMEHATITSMGGWTQTLIAHELAHQWFGDKITCGAWNDIWLNEGFATFGEHLTREKLLNTPAEFQAYLLNQKNFITSLPSGSVYVSDVNLANINAIFDGRLSYAKGGYVLRMLKWILGDDNFYQALRDYNSRPNLAYNYAKTEDFKNSLLQSTGKDFTEFFNEWIYGQGYPTYTIQYKQSSVNQSITFKISQTQSDSSVSYFKIPLPIKVTGTLGETAYFALDNDSNNQYFTEPLNFTVANVEFNYELQILEKNSTITQNSNLQTNQNSINSKLQIYPNPAKNSLTIFGLQTSEIFEIYSADGRKVKSGKFYPNSNINISGFAKGFYILKIAGQNFKFIKE
ncbi:Por secretion system C-terminal sorting domain-containing protein [Halpernia humi]|uniref:Aminopeptidase N n=1 Tax=Halpernia humi TaxID=493375 RepID=A0A1H6B049_9FLAO|nr:M1 family aminopeptidase [Halpernia humi]SEG53685.1 Por secretion system C-terminal sorting domain-containing protein [Halpernia humi]